MLCVEVPHVNQLYHLSWANKACVWRLMEIDAATGRCMLRTPRTHKTIYAWPDDLRHIRHIENKIKNKVGNYHIHLKTENQNKMSTQTAPSTKVITGKVRFSYVHVFEPAAVGNSTDEKYSVSIIIPKSDTKTIEEIKAAVEAAKLQGKSKWGGKIPANLKLPLRDGDIDRPEDEAYADSYFINASSKTKPGIVDADLKKLMSQEDFYSGCYGRASLNFYPFDANGNKGVACGLNNLQKTEDGQPLSGRASAEDDFGGGSDVSDLL